MGRVIRCMFLALPPHVFVPSCVICVDLFQLELFCFPAASFVGTTLSSSDLRTLMRLGITAPVPALASGGAAGVSVVVATVVVVSPIAVVVSIVTRVYWDFSLSPGLLPSPL